MSTANLPPVTSVVKEIKREQILAEYQKHTRLPMGILELIYDTCEKLDEKKIKAIKRGNYKFKGHRIQRPEFEPNQTIKGVEVIPPIDKQDKTELSRIEEVDS